MKTWHVHFRDTQTGYGRVVIMHGFSAAEIRNRASITMGPDDIIELVSWSD